MLDMPIAIIENLPASSSGPEEYIQAETVYPLPDGFVYLDEAVPGVFWDAKYATADNFTGEIVEGYASNRVALSADCAAALAVARDIAAEEGYRLLVWDAARPQRAVDDFVAWSKRPEDGKTKDAHYPNLQKRALIGEYVATRSGHSRGAAIDLTLSSDEGVPIDMGGIFDLMDARSHYDADGLSKAQASNRKMLRRIMKKAGFKPYESEWWHFSLRDEPFPGRYFDFIIGGTPSMLDWLSKTCYNE